jgi:drug/metabolite transporter (DMT)-like permease
MAARTCRLRTPNGENRHSLPWPNAMARPMALLLGLFAALCWSVHDLAARHFAPRTGAFRLGMMTETAGLLLVAPLFFHLPQASMHDWLLIVLLGGIYGAAIAGLFKAFAMAPVSIVGPFTAGYPALVVVWGILNGASPTLIQYLAMAAILVGAVIVGRCGHEDEDGNGSVQKGKLLELTFWIVLADLSFAAAIVLGQRLGPMFGDVTTAGLLRGPAIMLLLPFALTEPAPASKLTWKIGAMILAMGGLDVAALSGINYAGTLPGRELGAMGISAYGALATLLAMVWLNEKVSYGQWLGIGLIVAGVAGLGVQAG